MRLSLILSIISTFSLIANSGYSQQTKLSIDLENASIRDLLTEIGKKSEFSFWYSNNELTTNNSITISLKDQTVDKILDLALKEQGLTYEIKDKIILIYKRRDIPLYQQQKISGSITDGATGEPIIGANITVVGTTIGTVSDANGKFSLDVPSSSVQLTVSYVGYNTEIVQLNGQSNLEIKLIQDITKLDEIVVIGYGTAKKSDLSAAIGTVDSKQLSKIPSVRPENALQGMASGVEVYGNGGEPGSGSTILIRGVGSINNSTGPLVIIDGVAADINTVNPGDIKSMEILKDASYSAVYGARAANGVILITTKRGEKGVKISADVYSGVKNLVNLPKPLGLRDYAVIIDETNQNAIKQGLVGGTPPNVQKILDNSKTFPNTDWMDALTQQGTLNKQELSVSGGGENATFYFSGSHVKEVGTIIKNSHERYNIRLNSDFKRNKLKIGESFGLTYTKTDPYRGNGGAIIQDAIMLPPSVPVYDPSRPGGYGGTSRDEDGSDARNQVALLDLSYALNTNLLMNGNVYGEYEIFKGLTYRANFGMSGANFYNTWHNLPYDVNSWVDSQNYIGANAGKYSTAIFENTLLFEKSFNKHNISALAGYTVEKTKYRAFSGWGEGSFVVDHIHDINMLQGTNKKISGGQDANNLVSVLGRLTYNYDSRYILTALVRRDGSSKFGPNNKYGVFPSVSGAWRISKEGFMSDMDPETLSNLKVRASFGTLGRMPDASFAWQSTVWSGWPNAVFGSDAAFPTLDRNGFANEDLQWETEKQFNIGLDMGFMEEKLTVTADYYTRKTENMLVDITLPYSSGFTSTNANIGSMENKGYEIIATYKNKAGDLFYEISGNMAHFKNEVLDLGKSDVFLEGGYTQQGNTTRTEAGHPFASFYGFVADGIYQSDNEVNKDFNPIAKAGDVKFKDLNNDNILDSKDKTWLGTPYPKFTYSLNMNFEFKGFDMSMQFYAVSGVKILNFTHADWRSGIRNFNQSEDILSRWTPENKGNKWPRVILNDPNNNWRVSSLMLEDGDYLKLRFISLGYTIPSKLLNKVKIGKLRVYASAENVFTITGYSGISPEVGGYAMSRGVDSGSIYPMPRTLLGGIQISF